MMKRDAKMVALAIGIALGAALGAATGDMGLWLGMGAGIGAGWMSLLAGLEQGGQRCGLPKRKPPQA
ncbi:hypothetical protein SAMN05428989_2661 [Pseudoxanthomonas sp. GM95]|nr:hypothetical protein SAMN05428989_2661 [Pseudoxanthomonas sp. GM95]